MKNKQDWEKKLDNIKKNFRLQSKDGQYYESDLLVELGAVFRKQITKAREEGRREGVTEVINKIFHKRSCRSHEPENCNVCVGREEALDIAREYLKTIK